MKFRYSAVDRQGKKQRGWVEAPSRRLAWQKLTGNNWQVITLKPTTESAAIAFSSRKPVALRGSDLVIFTRQLATLLSAALPLEDALLTISQQCEKPAQQKLVQQLRQQVLEGRAFSEALASQKTFNRLFCAVVAAGESSGKLSLVLTRLADHTEQSQKIKSKLIQALLYPLLLTLIAIAVIAILLTSVVPKVVEQFLYLKAELPLSTRMLLTLSEGVQTAGPILLLLCAGLGVLAKRLLKDAQRRRRWDRLLLILPVIGKASLNLNTAHYAKTLSILSASAVPLLEAMQVSASVVNNSYARWQLAQAQERVREGAELSHALTKSGLFSPMMRHIVASGERSGELDSMLGRAADIQEEAFLHQLNVMVSLFTPLLIVAMAGMVFFIVLAILQPIMQMNSLAG
ncbi:type II secretion system inner membrane protein GspF [Kalamiella sp. sgz302252]|uniref:type II secretion system inner membrane protein GspF n=1 Tax=Pantoea sp. sgz302252 TaxID=3341827 RepID=UPI0036D319DF